MGDNVKKNSSGAAFAGFPMRQIQRNSKNGVSLSAGAGNFAAMPVSNDAAGLQRNPGVQCRNMGQQMSYLIFYDAAREK